MTTEGQDLGEVGMDEVIQSGTEVLSSDASAEGAESGEASADTGTGGTSSVDAEVTFYNVNDVPEDLRPTFKEMQGAFTKKTQALSAKLKEAEVYKTHAGLFREVMGDDRVVQYLEHLDAGGDPENFRYVPSGVAGGQRFGGGSAGGNGSEDSETDPVVADLRRQVQKLQADVSRTRQKQQFGDEKARFVAAHPDWEKYKDGMQKAFEQNPNRSFDDAYNWAFRQSYLAKVHALRQQKKRAGASVEGPGVPGEPSQEYNKVGTFREALAASVDQLGLNRMDYGL